MIDQSEEHFGPDSAEAIAIAESRFNAIKLFEDAVLVFEAKRWGTCVSLSILACEEVGKFVLLSTSLGKEIRTLPSLRNHHVKQSVFAERLHSCIRLRALDEYFVGEGINDIEQRDTAALKYLNRLASMLAAEGDISNEELERRVTSVPELKPIWNFVKIRSSADEAFEIAVKAASGSLDDVKQRGFYVDVTDNLVRSPRQFTEDDACLHLRAAELVVDSITLRGFPSDRPTPMHHVRLIIDPNF